MVIKPSANGTCTKLYETKSMALKVLPAKPKGNTQAVLLPSSVTGELHTVYMGILHTEVNRSYTNYFYKMQVRGYSHICFVVVFGEWLIASCTASWSACAAYLFSHQLQGRK